MIGPSDKRLRARKGAILVFVAVAMVSLLGMLALTLDVGSGNRQRRIAQAAADAGAISGAWEILHGHDSASIVASAFALADTNKFSGAVVEVNYPPDTGTYADNHNYIEVIVRKNVPTIFGSLWNRDTLATAARGVAGVSSESEYCVYALTNSGNAIDLPGDLDALAAGAGCSIYANSNINARKIWAKSIGAVGSVSGVRAGDVTSGAPLVQDPFYNLPVPPEAGCDYTNFVVNATVTLSPGTYCGGITINANKVANLDSGVYVLRGGGINATGNGTELHGTNVTIINTNGIGNDVSAFRPIKFGNTCYVTLSARTSGTYKGFVIYADPAGPTSGPNSVNEMCGKGVNGSNVDIRGNIYMPKQTFKLTNSNGKLVIAGALIAAVITGDNGGGQFTVIHDDTGNAVIKKLSLVQ